MIIDLVDSLEYTTTNCFGHQLHAALRKARPDVLTVALNDMEGHDPPAGVICRLKQRTLCRNVARLARWLGNAPIVVFDQDPWEAFHDSSPFKGTYAAARSALNVTAFALTTRWWCRFLADMGYPTMFTRMWVLPEYCASRPAFVDRPRGAGFVGQVHPYRADLFTALQGSGIAVDVMGGGLSYAGFLDALSTLQVYVHSESCELMVDGRPTNLSHGLWIKDVEAAARGCFSIRNRGEDAETYLAGIGTTLLYDDPREVPDLLSSVQKMDALERQSLIDDAVEFIRRSDAWSVTARALASAVEPAPRGV